MDVHEMQAGLARNGLGADPLGCDGGQWLVYRLDGTGVPGVAWGSVDDIFAWYAPAVEVLLRRAARDKSLPDGGFAVLSQALRGK